MTAIAVLAGLFDTPLHPILVNFTAALVPLSFFSDLLARVFKREKLAAAGWWMLFYAALITPATAFAGWWWMRSMEDMDHWQMPYHMWIGIGLAIVLVVWAAWRGIYYRRNQTPGWIYLAASCLLVGVVTVQGHLGGMMSFGSEDVAPSSQPDAHPMDHSGHMPPSTSPSDSTTLQWRDHIDVKE